MKQPLHVLLLVCMASALGGWGMARLGVAHREREAAAREQLAQQAAVEKLARDFGRLVGAADEVEIVFSESPRGKKVKFRDPAWFARLSGIVGAATYTRMGSGPWASSPRIILYRNGTELGELMMLNKVLRVLGVEKGGDFIVGPELVSAIRGLAHEKESNDIFMDERPSAGEAVVE